MLTKKKRAYIGLGLALVLLLSLIIVSNVAFKSYQVDLTENDLFTVSTGTKRILAEIDEPITLRLYFTKALGEGNPTHARHFIRVRELLERYTDLSNGKLRIQLLDAAPFSQSEDKAMAFGLNGVPFNEDGDLGYFGLAGTNSTDDTELIRYFDPSREKFLEYDLTKLVYRLTNAKKKVIGLISSLPIGGAGTVPNRDTQQWPAIDRIREFFDLRPLPTYVDEIPEEIDALLIIHPKGFDKHAMYAIDQFVMNGGRALVFVDTVVESGGRIGVAATGATRSQFDRLLNSWGLSLVPDKVAGDLDAARRVRVQHEGRIAVVDYIAWLTLGSDNFDANDVVTSDINKLNLGTAGLLKPVKVPGLTVTPLVTTGTRAMPVASSNFFRQPDVVGLFRNFKPENRKLMLAARTTGKAKSAFPAGPPSIDIKAPTGAQAGAAAPKTDPKKVHLSQSKKPINTIVVSDVDMLHDEFWADIDQQQGRQILIPNANNVDFVINALDNLTGSDALIELRGRANSSRPFYLIQRIRQQAERQFRQKEKQLQERLAKARGEIDALTQGEAREKRVMLSAEEKTKIDSFRRELVMVRKELREVQHALRTDLDQLDGWLKFLNIGAIPLLLVIGVVGTAGYRRLRTKRSATAHDGDKSTAGSPPR